MNRKLFILLITILLVGCSKDIKISTNIPKALTIYPYLQNGQPIKIYVRFAKDIKDTTKTTQIENSTAYIYNNDICVDTVKISNEGIGISKISPDENKNYRFKVIADGYPGAETEVLMPKPIQGMVVDTTTIRNEFQITEGYFLQTNVKFKIDHSKTTYYSINFSEKEEYIISPIWPVQRGFKIFRGPLTFCSTSMLEYYNYYSSGNDGYFRINEPKGLFENFSRLKVTSKGTYAQGSIFYFNDQFVNSDTLSISIIANSMKTDLLYKNPIQYRLEVSTLSPDYYKALYSFSKYNINKEQDLPISEPIPIYSSVKGGYGFAAACATAVDSSISNKSYKDFFKQ